MTTKEALALKADLELTLNDAWRNISGSFIAWQGYMVDRAVYEQANLWPWFLTLRAVIMQGVDRQVED